MLTVEEYIHKKAEEKKKIEEKIRLMSHTEIIEICIYSNLICDGPELKNGDEIGQNLKILRDGTIEFKRTHYSKSHVKSIATTEILETDTKKQESYLKRHFPISWILMKSV